MATVLITGASRGFGLEFARRYAEAGWRVIATARDPRNSVGLRRLGVERHRLDIGDFAAIDAIAAELKGVPIDLLLLNAAINPQAQGPGAAGTDYDVWPETMRINVMAQLRLAVAFALHVAASERKQIVAISSVGASVSAARGGQYVYRSSKAALNLCMAGLAREYKERGITVVALGPGWTKTDMGGPNATYALDDSITRMMRVMERLTPADSGRFIGRDGEDTPW
jgi:NAD(P)-dependent dehydrogenase (short-subunit alcohol dehydrogenase family)